MRVKKQSQTLHGKPHVYIALTACLPACLPYRPVKYGGTLIPHWVFFGRSSVRKKKLRQNLHLGVLYELKYIWYTDMKALSVSPCVCPSLIVLKSLAGYF